MNGGRLTQEDFYGKRLATCSADHHIKVFDKTANGWELCDSWKAHDSAVVKVTWAGPEFGQILASCSHDATVRIFEEDPREPINSGRRWKRKHIISDFRGPLYDIEFAPSHLGLKLASIGSDGVFRIHEAMDPNTMAFWTTATEVNMLTNPVARQLQSSFALSWCPSMFFKEYIVACVLEDAFIYQRDHLGKYIRVAQLPEHKGLIRDVAWAPSMGRGYQLIATASKDGYVRIFKITLDVGNNDSSISISGAGGIDNDHDDDDDDDDDTFPRVPQALKVELLSQFDDHHGEVWRVSWNLTEFLFPHGTDTSLKDAPQVIESETFASKGRKNCIDRLLVFESNKTGHKLVAVARRSGSVELYDADEKYEEIKSWDPTVTRESEKNISKDAEEEPFESEFEERKPENSLLSNDPFIVGFDLLVEKNVLVSCTSDGSVVVYDLDTLEMKEVSWGGIESASLKGQNRYARKNNGNGCISNESARPASKISIFKVNPYNEELFAYGGNLLNLTIVKIDLTSLTLTQTWKAKNVKNDRLDLEMPIIINNVFWFTEPSKKDPSNVENMLLTLTGDGFIRQYRPSAQMRPISEAKIGENNITNSNTMHNRAGATGVTGASRKEVDIQLKVLCPGNNDHSIIYTDDRSSITYFDFKKNINGGKYAGPTGTIQALHSYKNELLAAGGLDRYLRVYNITSRESIAKVYVGTHISGVWIIDDEELTAETKKIKRRAGELIEEDEQEADEMWNELEKANKKKKSSK